MQSISYNLYNAMIEQTLIRNIISSRIIRFQSIDYCIKRF